MITRTKIICTMGPAVTEPAKIRELISAGMNVARLNFSHGTHEEHARTIALLKEAREELKVPLAIMLDTKGSEVRIGKLSGGSLHLPSGHLWLLTPEECEGTLERVTIKPAAVVEKIPLETTILFDNGNLSAKVVEKRGDGIVVQIVDGGELKSGKGVNIPGCSLGLPVLSEKDIADIRFGCQMDIDLIAASFICTAEHVIAVKQLLKSENKSDIWVIAKIENRQGVDNLDAILQVADGIMVARGDLGVEVPLVEVPRLQKMMIHRSVAAGKPAVTATHMLESMITHARPTRAEASDVANAIYDSTSAIMLSAETAVGDYPILATETMRAIATISEQDFPYQQFFEEYSAFRFTDVPSSITLAAVKTAYSSGATAIFAFTKSGTTPRLLARLRPKIPILAATPSIKCYNQMALLWGVVPFLGCDTSSLSEAFKELSSFALERGFVTFGDQIIVTAGQPFGFAGTTNMMLVENIGDVLVRGHRGFGKVLHGNVIIALTPEQKKNFQVQGQILVVPYFDEAYRQLARDAAAVVLQNLPEDSASEERLLQFAKESNTPVLLRADDATRVLKEGQLVTVDPEKLLIYKGIVV